MSERPLILVVEDNVPNQLLTSSVLEREGYEVVLAESSGQALERLAALSPDLILMDVQLPGVDGLSLTRTIKSAPATAAIPVVALTANAMVGDSEQAFAAGCAGYISKPIDTRTFASEVRKYLSAPAGSSPRTGTKKHGSGPGEEKD